VSDGMLFVEGPRLIRDFRQISLDAERLYKPVIRYGMFSGGDDSAIAIHALWEARLIDAAVHINTGIGIPQTRDFVRDYCRGYRIPLIEKHPPKMTYRELVLKFGFPGPGMHNLPYRILKELAVDELVREAKTKRTDRVALLTGVRLSESTRRMGYVEPITVKERRPCQVWVAPMADWTSDDLAAYRAKHRVPQSEVAALLHMSGECLCGAFARPEEIKDLEAFYPDVARGTYTNWKPQRKQPASTACGGRDRLAASADRVVG
jgi:3'-phosphoadenosine 5'-phosphosulfate sulfotransferase (PAPS reductase)/FAD synthetase